MTWDAHGNISNSDFGMRSSEWGRRRDAGIPAVIEETGPVYYVREPNGSLIVRLDGQYTNYYHFDALGSTRLLTNSSGAVTDTYGYDAWGGVSQGGSTVQPYQFVGQLGYYFPVQDENFPLLHLGVRFYDVSTGRFTQVDPVRDAYGWYVYSNDGPTLSVDPSGQKCTPILGMTKPDPNPSISELSYKRERRWRFVHWVPVEWTSGLGCVCHWLSDVWRTPIRHRSMLQAMSCMYRDKCGNWSRSIEWQPFLVTEEGPGEWEPDSPPGLREAGCAGHHTSRGILHNMGLGSWCDCQLRPPSEPP